jgi:hypothetical protein
MIKKGINTQVIVHSMIIDMFDLAEVVDIQNFTGRFLFIDCEFDKIQIFTNHYTEFRNCRRIDVCIIEATTFFKNCDLNFVSLAAPTTFRSSTLRYFLINNIGAFEKSNFFDIKINKYTRKLIRDFYLQERNDYPEEFFLRRFLKKYIPFLYRLVHTDKLSKDWINFRTFTDNYLVKPRYSILVASLEKLIAKTSFSHSLKNLNYNYHYAASYPNLFKRFLFFFHRGYSSILIPFIFFVVSLHVFLNLLSFHNNSINAMKLLSPSDFILKYILLDFNFYNAIDWHKIINFVLYSILWYSFVSVVIGIKRKFSFRLKGT